MLSLTSPIRSVSQLNETLDALVTKAGSETPFWLKRNRKKMGADAKTQEQHTNKSAATTSIKPITAAEFLTWKRQKDVVESTRKAEAARKREEDIAAGRVQLNGRELFIREPWVFDNEQY